MSVTRRVRVVASCVALALTAASCGSSEGHHPPTAGTGSAQTHYPLSITEPGGKVATVRRAPTRIVTVDVPSFAVEDLLALGVTPIGGEVESAQPTAVNQADGIPRVDDLPSFQDLGRLGAPDLEAIAAVHPDLIVGAEGSATGDLPQLEDIAPVVDLDQSAAPTGSGVQRLPWYSELEALARVLGRQRQANAFLARFAAAAARARPALAGKTVSVVAPQAAGLLTVDGPDFQTDQYLEYLGLTIEPLPEGGKTFAQGPEFAESLSEERVGELTGQYLLVNGRTTADTDAFLANPLVKKLPSVAGGRLIVTTALTFHDFGTINGCISALDAIPYIPEAFEAAGRST